MKNVITLTFLLFVPTTTSDCCVLLIVQVECGESSLFPAARDSQLPKREERAAGGNKGRPGVISCCMSHMCSPR